MLNSVAIAIDGRFIIGLLFCVAFWCSVVSQWLISR
jgi:hypothetical protein